MRARTQGVWLAICVLLVASLHGSQVRSASHCVRKHVSWSIDPDMCRGGRGSVHTPALTPCVCQSARLCLT